jgi:hypothetical protein
MRIADFIQKNLFKYRLVIEKFKADQSKQLAINPVHPV